MSEEKPNRFYRTKADADYVTALEALAVELAGANERAAQRLDALADEFMADGNIDTVHGWADDARAALASPLLAEIRAKGASHG